MLTVRARRTGVMLLALMCGYLLALYRVGPSDGLVSRLRVAGLYPTAPSMSWSVEADMFRSKPATADVTFVGDSLTAFADWDALIPRLRSDNHGIPGDTSAGVLKRLAAGERLAPTVVVMIGTNDRDAGIDTATSIANVEAIVGRLRGRRVLLLSTLPAANAAVSAQTARIAEAERRLCRSGACSFVDIRPPVSRQGRIDDRFFVDGVHLNWTGYRAVAPIVEAALRSV